MMDTGLPPRDHNQPPETVAFDAVKKRVDDLVATANRWATERPTITDKEMADKCDGFIAQVDKELKAAEAMRREINKPHEDIVKANNDQFRPLTQLLETAKKLLKPMVTAWLVAEQNRRNEEQRKAEAEALRKLEEEQAALKAAEEAAMKPGGNVVHATVAAQTASEAANKALERVAAGPVRAAVKSDFSARARSLRTVWGAKLTNLDTAIAHYKTHPDMKALVERLANADVRAGGRSIPGFDVTSTQTAA